MFDINYIIDQCDMLVIKVNLIHISHFKIVMRGSTGSAGGRELRCAGASAARRHRARRGAGAPRALVAPALACSPSRRPRAPLLPAPTCARA